MISLSRNPNWEYPTWLGLPIIPTDHAMKRAFDIGMDIYDIAAILEGGYDCEKGSRRMEIRERCSKWRGKLIRIIVSKQTSGWVDGNYAWIVISVKPL